MQIRGEVVEVGTLEGIYQPGLVIRRNQGFVTIYGLTREELRDHVGNLFGEEVCITLSRPTI